MSKPLFRIEILANSATRFYFTTNWTMTERDENGAPQLYLIGDFYSSPISWYKELPVDDFHVTVVRDEPTIRKYQAAVDQRRINVLMDSVKGLAENLFDKNLPAEIKEILERTPEVGTAVLRAVESGLTSVFEKISKGK